MLILGSHHTKKNDYNQSQVQIFAIITPIFTKKLSLAFNSCRLIGVAQRHDGFRAMPSAAFGASPVLPQTASPRIRAG